MRTYCIMLMYVLSFVVPEQQYTQVSLSQESKITPLFKNSLEIKKATGFFKSITHTDDALFLALKTGYQTFSPEYVKNFPGSWLIDISAGGVFNNSWQAGLSLRFWNSTIENYRPEGLDTSYNKDLKGMAVLFLGNYKFNIEKDLIFSFIGLGFGNYEIKETSGKKQYLCISINTGFEVKINKFIAANFEICFNRLLGFAENSNSYNNFEFKIGPALYLSY